MISNDSGPAHGPEQIARQIEDFLRDMQQVLGKRGLLLGLSGGLDSAVAATLSVSAVAAAKVRLFYLPDRDSKAVHHRHARLIAQDLGVELQIIDLTPLLDKMGVYKLLPISALPGQRLRESAARLGKTLLGFGPGESLLEARFRPEPNSFVAKANAYAMAKHRLRMVVLYQQAETFNDMVVGAANKTEYLTGTFSQWGCDHCADVMPLLHLYRSQLYPLARFLGVPEEIISKAADPDLIPGVDNKEVLLGSFDITDRILSGLETGIERSEMVQAYGRETVDRILSLWKLSKPMREAPYQVNITQSHRKP